MSTNYLNDLLNRTRLFISGSGSNENSILKSWVENRLREYFVVQATRHRNRENGLYLQTIKADPFDITCYDLKVIDVQIHHSNNENERFDNFIDILMGINPKDRPSRSQHKNYRTDAAYLTVTYQENENQRSTSPTQTVHLMAQVGEIEDLDIMEVHPFVPYSETHGIEIYTKVFPTLEDWAATKEVEVTFPIPKCYCGFYEDTRKVSVDQLVSTENDILSKVAAGMRINEETPKYESHRILVLENMGMNGFERKNVDNSLFLPLANVIATLRNIVAVHAISYAFTEVTGKGFTETWPFLVNKDYLPYLMIRAVPSFTELIDLAEEYLAENSASDTDTLLSHLRLLNSQLAMSLAKVSTPSYGPVSLIHGALCYSTSLFRHSLIPLSTNDESNNEETETTLEECDDLPRANLKHKGNQKKQKEREESREPKKIPQSGQKKEMSKVIIKREVAITDWKNATFGSPMNDVAYLILTSLPPKTRALETQALLKLYWTEFEKITSFFQIPVAWTIDELYREYLHSVLLACITMTSNFQLTNSVLEVLIDAFRELISHEVI